MAPARSNVRRLVVAGVAGSIIGGSLIGQAPPAVADPTTSVTTVVSGLTIPWDLTWVGDDLLYTLRLSGQLWSKRGNAAPRRVSAPVPPVYTNAEGGLLGIVADPGAASNRRFYTCQSVATSSGGPQDVAVVRWRLTDDGASAVRVGSPVITGIPINRGRHNGCRLRFGPDGKLYVGTGDAATASASQDLNSLGGKVLRVNADGTIPSDNPFFSRGGRARYVWNYGHRNVQGLAVRPGTSQMWTAEHGTDRDDEINQSVRGANYGWRPGPSGPYDESPPMTDLQKFPNARAATWSSGSPTVATSGLTFLSGSAWGRWEGSMAAAMLKGQGIKLIHLDAAGRLAGTQNIAGLGSYGRIRTAQQGPDGALWFTTSNGGGRDVIGRIAPTARPRTLQPGQNVSSTGVSATRVGSELYVFFRTSGNQVTYRRSTNDARSWYGWADVGLTSAAAPSVASSGSGRVDLATIDGSGRVVVTSLVNRVEKSRTDLGGTYRTATITSARAGRLDVLALAPDGSAHRRQFDGSRWSAWTSLGGKFSSTFGASSDRATNRIVVTGRDPWGGAWERTLPERGNGSGWVRRSGSLWSARALGDQVPGRELIGASVGSDGYLSFRHNGVVQGMAARFTSDIDVVTRADGSWIVFGRATNGMLSYVNGRTGQGQQVNLGGSLR